MAEKRILPIDSQILDAVQKCGFYTYLNFIKNYRPTKVDYPLERGDLGHTLLEIYYRLLKEGYDWDTARTYADKVGREKYQSYDLDLETCEWVIQTFHQYTEFYRFDGINIIGIEESFSKVIYEDDELVIVYQGKIDLHAKLPIIGEVVMDHKFRGMKAEYTPLDNQMIGYAIAKNISVVYVNEVGLQKSYKPEQKFRRVPLSIGSGLKQRWISNTVIWGKVLDHYIQYDLWPQSHLKTAPQGISQCSRCTYSMICNSENQEEMNRKIQQHFKIGERWDVGKQLDEEPTVESS